MAEQNTNQIPGWSSVTLNPQVSVEMMIQFLNILNQRLCVVEQNVQVTNEDGKPMSIAEYQYECDMKEMARQQAEAENQGE